MDSVQNPDWPPDGWPPVGVGRRLLSVIATTFGVFGGVAVLFAQSAQERHRTEAVALFWLGIGSLFIGGCGRAIVHRHFWFLWLAPFVLAFIASNLLPSLQRAY